MTDGRVRRSRVRRDARCECPQYATKITMVAALGSVVDARAAKPASLARRRLFRKIHPRWGDFGKFFGFFQKFFGDADGVPSVAPDTARIVVAHRVATPVTMHEAPIADASPLRRASGRDTS